MHHFNDLTKTLSEAKRILKKDGLIFSYDPNRNNPFFWLYRRKSSWFYSQKGVTENEEPLKKVELEKIMQYHNFKKIEVYGISNMSMKSVGDKKVSFLLPLYNLADYLLDIIPFVRKSFGSFLITKCRK